MGLAPTLLVATLVLLVAILAVRASARLGLPSLLIYLGLGLVVGTSDIGLGFSDIQLANTLGTLALVIILAEGGLTTRWSDVRRHVVLGILLSTVGVVVSIAVMAVFMALVLGIPWQLAVVTGAIISSTDAAAVFSVLRGLGLPARITGALELESGLNDAPVILLVTFLSVDIEVVDPWWEIALLVSFELVAGVVVGAAMGWLAVQVMRRGTLPSTGLYPLLAMTLLLMSYAVASLVYASGFLAVYVAGVVVGNSRLPFRRAVVGFAEGTAWLAQIGLFVMLGVLVAPDAIPDVLLDGLLIGAVLLFVARPLSVAAAATPLGIPLRSQAFISWAGLRGAVPIVLATIPVSNGLQGSREILHVVFVLVVVFTLVQGTTLPWVAKALGLAGMAQTQELQVEVAALDEMGADLMTVGVPEGSRLHGIYLSEMRLPELAVISLVIRDDKRFVPDQHTRVRIGDELLVVCTSGVREQTERRLRAMARSGRLARWYGDDGREYED